MASIRMGILSALVSCSAPLLASCAATESTAASISTRLYSCDDGKKITAVIDDSRPDDPTITLSVNADPALEKIAMRYVQSANGEKASDGKLTWWTKGGEGFLANDEPDGDGEVVIGGCREIPAER